MHAEHQGTAGADPIEQLVREVYQVMIVARGLDGHIARGEMAEPAEDA